MDETQKFWARVTVMSLVVLVGAIGAVAYQVRSDRAADRALQQQVADNLARARERDRAAGVTTTLTPRQKAALLDDAGLDACLKLSDMVGDIKDGVASTLELGFGITEVWEHAKDSEIADVREGARRMQSYIAGNSDEATFNSGLELMGDVCGLKR